MKRRRSEASAVLFIKKMEIPIGGDRSLKMEMIRISWQHMRAEEQISC